MRGICARRRGRGLFHSQLSEVFAGDEVARFRKDRRRQTMGKAIHDVSLKSPGTSKLRTCRDWIRTSSSLQDSWSDARVSSKGIVQRCERFRQRQAHCFPHSWRVSGVHFGDSLGGANVWTVTTHRLPHSRRDAGNGSQPQTAGYDPDPDKLIAMRIHGATPEWLEQ